jgi:hypothetical protein
MAGYHIADSKALPRPDLLAPSSWSAACAGSVEASEAPAWPGFSAEYYVQYYNSSGTPYMPRRYRTHCNVHGERVTGNLAALRQLLLQHRDCK